MNTEASSSVRSIILSAYSILKLSRRAEWHHRYASRDWPVHAFAACDREQAALQGTSVVGGEFYLTQLVKLARDRFMLPNDVESVHVRYPYIKAEYVSDGDGGYMAGFIDITWEPGSYPLRLLEEIVRMMKEEADRHGARFWLALPLTATLGNVQFFKQISLKHGFELVDPVSNGYRERWVAKCGGTFVFKFDGHYSRCGHLGQAGPIAAALGAPDTVAEAAAK